MTELEDRQRTYSMGVTRTLTGLATFLGGFAFAAMTILLSLPNRSFYFRVAFLLTASSALVWVGLAVLGSYLSVAAHTASLINDSPLARVSSVFAYGVYGAVLLFFANVAVLAFLISPMVGYLTSGASALVAVGLFSALVTVSRHWDDA